MAEAIPLTIVGIVIIAAIVLSTLVKKLGQNPVMGFILAGFILGPAVVGFLHPNDILVKGFGEMGLFILLFYLGLELSLKDFLKAGVTSLGLALIDMAFLIGIGFAVAYLAGFSFFFSLIIGFMLFSTSTAIVAKFALDNNLLNLPSAKLAISILILQDFLGILLLVLITTLVKAGTSFDFGITAIMFAAATFFVVYQLSQKVESWLLHNSFGHIEVTLYALGVGLVVATLADVLTLSTALGAYFAGFALAETTAGKKIKADIQFLRDFFLLFFFVSFGTTIFFNTGLNTVVIPEIGELIFLLGIAFILALGIIVVNLIVFSLFGPFFGLKREDASISAIMLTPLGEFVVIIAASTVALLSTKEAPQLPTIAFLLIATTLIIFQPLYKISSIHKKISALLPNLFPLRTNSVIIQHTPESITRLKEFGINVFVIIAMGWISMLLYNQLPNFNVPIVYSREFTSVILFLLFAAVPAFKAGKALKKLIYAARHHELSELQKESKVKSK